MALKLDRNQRWLAVRNYLHEDEGINVNFSNIHYDYYSACKYVTKQDEHVLESDNHPDLWSVGAPRTNTARNNTYRSNSASTSEGVASSKENDGDCTSERRVIQEKEKAKCL